MTHLPRPDDAKDVQASSMIFLRAGIIAVLAALAVGWGGLALDLERQRGAQEEQGRRAAERLAIAYAHDIENTIAHVDALLRVARTEVQQHGRLVPGSDTLAATRFGPLRDAVVQVGLVDADGNLTFTNAQTLAAPIYIGDRDHFRAHVDAIDDRVFVGKPVMTRSTAQRLVPFSRRITGPGGRFAGVVVALLPPESLSRTNAATDPGHDGVLVLLRETTVLAHSATTPPEADASGRDLAATLPGRDFAGQTWHAAGPLDTLPRLIHAHRLDGLPLVALAAIAEGDYLAPYRQGRTRQLAIAAALSLALLAGFLALLRRIRRLDAALAEANDSRERYRQLVEQAPVAVVAVDAQGRIDDANAAAQDLLGYEHGELVGRPFNQFVDAGNAQAATAQFAELIRHGQGEGLEIMLSPKFGKPRLVSVVSRTETRRDGALVHCILQDIGAAREQQNALKASEARLRGIIENINVVTWEFDPGTWQFTYVSPRIEAMFGYPAADWTLPNFWPEHLHPADRVSAMQFSIGKTRECLDHEFEFRLRKRNGNYVWVRDIVKVLADGGRPVRLTGAMLDISEQKNTALELARQHALLRSLIDSVPDLIFFKDRNGVYLGSNRAFAEFSGRPESEQTGRSDYDLFDREVAERFRESDRLMLESGQPRRNEEWVIYPDGRRVLLDTLKAPLVGADGEALGLIGVSRDITEFRRATSAALLAQAVFDATTEGIMVTDEEGRILSVNPAFTAITGWSATAVLGMKPSLLKSGRHGSEFYAAMWNALRDTGHWSGEIWNRRKNGDAFVEWMTINVLRDPGGEGVRYVALFSDITVRKRQEDAIWRQANFDALTGLANRSLFHDRLERALARARRLDQQVGLIYIDLDRFKLINDTLGHDAGDRLLVEIATRLRRCVREEDTVARLGGDEFTILIQGLADHEPLPGVAEKILAALAEPVDLGGSLQYVSGSVGVTVFPGDADAAGDLLKNADIAMYQAKEGGRNRYQFYSADMQLRTLARAELEQELRRAVAESGFVLHYQPIVDVDSGELLAAEALVRWRHPVRGLLLPADFLAVAEDTGLMVAIGEWVIGETCRQWQAWHAAGLAPPRLAINLSTVHFRHTGLAACLAAALDKNAMPRQMLSLEVTEALMLGHGDVVAARLKDLREVGVHYTLDNFGTGHTSLASLKSLPFDVVKIDRSFVAQCPRGLDEAQLIEAIVFMAHSLGLVVVAEGVETSEQLAYLRDVGCDHVQGYLISRPLPGASFTRLLAPGATPLLPDRQRTPEQSRFLAALRREHVDLEAWLPRLLAERDGATAAAWTAGHGRVDGLAITAALDAHLQWRRRIESMISDDDADPMSLEEAASVEQCDLGRWLDARLGTPMAELPDFAALRLRHREFHQIAASIVADLRLGRRAEARRRTRGLPLRQASHAIVTALIDLYIAARLEA